jgi:hypothetical protein
MWNGNIIGVSITALIVVLAVISYSASSLYIHDQVAYKNYQISML